MHAGLESEGVLHDVGGGRPLGFHNRHQHDTPSQQATHLHVVQMSCCEAVHVGSCGFPAGTFVVSTTRDSGFVSGMARCMTLGLLAMADTMVSG